MEWKTDSAIVRDIKECLTLPLGRVTFLYPGKSCVTNYCCDYDVGITRHSTLLVKLDNAAVGLQGPGAQEHTSSFGDVGLTGVGFGRANQNADTTQRKRKQYLNYQSKGNLTNYTNNFCFNPKSQ